ncbi:protein-tyrosine phosphatase-like protein [Polychytrium aggregatum]|uniref:protein-tyrosine phosphatase-like protein n=1 Tax=Polychytrium aggregatum TaxID=110093 RepID=UPI0022FEEC8C|nr:protein-tyrosine phosphatase-like protein [Polychytrium aggregatum]KAI9205661.1 protein-tyrosine phosphatase-like protein [Polychytrium aggregatum]
MDFFKPFGIQPRTSHTHPINISWLIPPELDLVLPPDPRGLGDDLLAKIQPRPPNKQAAPPLCVERPNGEPSRSQDRPESAELLQSNHGREDLEKAEAGLCPIDSVLCDPTEDEQQDAAGPSARSTTDVPSPAAQNTRPSRVPAAKPGNFALSSCPGKKVRLDTGPVNGRAMISRDLNMDFERIASAGVRLVVNCLDNTELEYLGAPWDKYQAAAAGQGIDVIRIPIAEGYAPKSIDDVEEVLKEITKRTSNGVNILCHCRGGVGRAGVIACCWLLREALVSTPDRSIQYLRLRRSPKAIETKFQEDFVVQYYRWLTTKQGQPGSTPSAPQ